MIRKSLAALLSFSLCAPSVQAAAVIGQTIAPGTPPAPAFGAAPSPSLDVQPAPEISLTAPLPAAPALPADAVPALAAAPQSPAIPLTAALAVAVPFVSPAQAALPAAAGSPGPRGPAPALAAEDPAVSRPALSQLGSETEHVASAPPGSPAARSALGWLFERSPAKAEGADSAVSAGLSAAANPSGLLEDAAAAGEAPGQTLEALRAKASRLAPVSLAADISGLSKGDLRALTKLIEASRIIDDIYLQQLSAGAQALRHKLELDPTPLGEARLRLFRANNGPWSHLDELESFLPGIPARQPLGANLYPTDMMKEEFEAWVGGLPKDQQESARGFFTVIRRGPAGELTALPYREAYAAQLNRAAALLREAAAATDNASLRSYLSLRADAFLTDDYFASDVAWMDLDSPIEPTIGPYETYIDRLFSYKAAFQSFITLRDDRDTARLKAFSAHLQELEDRLPMPARFRNPKVGAMAPIRVVNVVYSAGDGAHRPMPAAFNLPNDENVATLKGTKNVLLKNIQKGKFEQALAPIARRILSENQRGDADFEAFFLHTLLHEISHGLGPRQIEVSGRRTTVRHELKGLFNVIEETKADMLGLLNLQYLMDNAERLGLDLPHGPDAERKIYATYLASIFRVLRFGSHEAHGQAVALQLNSLLDQGGFVAHADGTFSVDLSRIKDAVRMLAGQVLLIEAEGDARSAQSLVDALVPLRPAAVAALGTLSDIPVDIDPSFPTAVDLASTAKEQRAYEASLPRFKPLWKKIALGAWTGLGLTGLIVGGWLLPYTGSVALGLLGAVLVVEAFGYTYHRFFQHIGFMTRIDQHFAFLGPLNRPFERIASVIERNQMFHWIHHMVIYPLGKDYRQAGAYKTAETAPEIKFWLPKPIKAAATWAMNLGLSWLIPGLLAGVLAVVTMGVAPASLAFLAGVAGYGLLISYTHEAFHLIDHPWINNRVLRPVFRFFRWLDKIHVFHHWDQNVNFTILFPLMDILYGTYLSPKGHLSGGVTVSDFINWRYLIQDARPATRAAVISYARHHPPSVAKFKRILGALRERVRLHPEDALAADLYRRGSEILDLVSPAPAP